jgi:ABC-type uncharacterized transport system permease subunit
LLYRPVSVLGYAAVLLAALFCIQVFLAVDRRSHSVSDTLYGIYPFVLPTLLLLERIAAKTSGRPD